MEGLVDVGTELRRGLTVARPIGRDSGITLVETFIVLAMNLQTCRHRCSATKRARCAKMSQ